MIWVDGYGCIGFCGIGFGCLGYTYYYLPGYTSFDLHTSDLKFQIMPKNLVFLMGFLRFGTDALADLKYCIV